jgi:hypothetical protein
MRLRWCAFVTQAELYQLAGVPEYQCRFVWKGVGDMVRLYAINLCNSHHI